jgi:hypothetical protein
MTIRRAGTHRSQQQARLGDRASRDSDHGPKTNAYRAVVDPRGWRCGFISRVDVADFLVNQIDNDAFLHKTPVLTS